jgi:NADH-quinone oxidoreductase subunit C
MESNSLVTLLKSKLGEELLSCSWNINTAECSIKPQKLLDICRILKMDSQLSFEMLVSVTAVDWMDQRDDRFEMVYHFLSLTHNTRLRLKASLPESNPSIASLTQLWLSADFMERECFDMYGIKFVGHPDLRRILMYDEFVGYPLRKDYPIQGKQPRVPMRHPEVANTATQMKRSPLVTINSKNPNKTANAQNIRN